MSLILNSIKLEKRKMIINVLPIIANRSNTNNSPFLSLFFIYFNPVKTDKSANKKDRTKLVVSVQVNKFDEWNQPAKGKRKKAIAISR